MQIPSLARRLSAFLILVAGLGIPASSRAQIGGDGAISGTVTDQTGAIVPNASVTAVENGTGTTTARTTSNSGYYLISPLIPGVYTVHVKAPGFAAAIQENVTVDALKVVALNFGLRPGTANQTVVVSAAPPQLDPENGTLNLTMENHTYSQLPILMSGQQRDPTAFATLEPGVQPGNREGLFMGTGSTGYLAEMYVDGLPLTESGQQADNRAVSYALPLDAVNQFQVETSGQPAEYQGAGFTNYTVKSGTNSLHGTVFDYLRNTVFDTWCYTCKAATEENAAGQTVPAPKPAEHQNEFGFTVGGPVVIPKIYNGRDKAFWFFAYDQFHYTYGVNPSLLSVPTLAMRDGDFSQLLASNGGPGVAVYDPTTQGACTAHSTTGPCRYQFGYGAGQGMGAAGNPVPTGAPNVIPTSEISPIAQYLQQFLPSPTNSNITNNYLGGIPGGNQNFEIAGRGDVNLTRNQKLSLVFIGGKRGFIGYDLGNSGITLPFPYLNGQVVTTYAATTVLEHSWVLSPRMVNQIKYGFDRLWGPVDSPTLDMSKYEASTAGITGLPSGLAANAFPGVDFSGTDAPTTWTNNSQYTQAQTTFTLLDNFQWLKGRHSLTFGAQFQWLQDNESNFDTPSSSILLNVGQNETGTFEPGTSTFNATTGYSYASYMLGALQSTGVTLQPFTTLGGRYKNFAPYFQDDFRATEKLTVNLGLRWDYLPPFHERENRWSYLNTDEVNPATGNLGALEFAGYGPLSCHCKTPVHTYYKNFGPRIGFGYELTPKTVLRGAFSVLYTHGGGVGGRQGAENGTGQLGFTASPSFYDSSSGPAFYLNNSAYFSSVGLANTNFGGPGYVLPSPPAQSTSEASLNAGNYVNSSGAFVSASSAPGYGDPYVGGRAPTFNFFNIGVQRDLTRDMAISIYYAGSQSHFLTNTNGNARGAIVNELNPAYLTLGNALTEAGTATNLAAAGVTAPYPGYPTAANLSTQATVAQALVKFPQYTSVTDEWGNVSNASYNALQLILKERPRNGLSFTLNYTYSKALDDAGTFRTGFPIPASAIATGRAWPADRIERSWGTASEPQVVTGYGVYELPFGKGRLDSGNTVVRNVISGWQLSGIYTYSSGNPLAITGATCPSLVGQGQCMPNYNPNFSGPARQNGSWGKGVTAATLGSVRYINPEAFEITAPFQIGDIARTRADNLSAPSTYNINASVRRTFNLVSSTKFNAKFILEADVSNLTNKVTFGGIGSTVQYNPAIPSTASSGSFGEISSASGNRDWQFSGRINF